MKQITLIFSLILFVGFALVSCSDDDNSSSPKQNVLPTTWPWTVNGTVTNSDGKQSNYLDDSPIIKKVAEKYSLETSSGNTKIYVKLPKVLTSGTTSECTVFHNGITMAGQKANYNIVYTGTDAYAGTISVIGRSQNKTVVGCNLQFKIRLTL